MKYLENILGLDMWRRRHAGQTLPRLVVLKEVDEFRGDEMNVVDV